PEAEFADRSCVLLRLHQSLSASFIAALKRASAQRGSSRARTASATIRPRISSSNAGRFSQRSSSGSRFAVSFSTSTPIEWVKNTAARYCTSAKSRTTGSPLARIGSMISTRRCPACAVDAEFPSVSLTLIRIAVLQRPDESLTFLLRCLRSGQVGRLTHDEEQRLTHAEQIPRSEFRVIDRRPPP